MTSVNNMLVGKSFALTFFDVAQGRLVDFGDVIGLKYRRINHMIESRPYNDDPRFGYIPGGYELMFDLIRTNPDIGDWQYTYDTIFRAGGDLPGGILTETINYTGQTIQVYQFLNFVFALDDEADIAREKNVTAKGQGRASARNRIS